MSTKKTNRTGKQNDKANKELGEGQEKFSFSPSSIKTFLSEVQAEFRKVVWPGRKQTFGLTGFVILLVIVIAVYLGSVDLLLGKLVSTVLK